ncbi:peptidase domain-containing ABC transporter [Dyella sp. EPa41]|uniref:peptidase domain-containing ABC transporter n=1 Tax=Dyella sp. EPa41 TaxID=1561194 RepID=UPI001F24A7C1|nr:peptidase domain-containing ABC transporter [Dyella sp. EPa41]
MADGSTHAAQTPRKSFLAALQFGWSRHLPMMLQTEATECGLACLAMIASYYGHDVDLAGLRRRFASSLKGITLTRLGAMANQLGFASRPLRLDMDHLSQLQTPCVLHWDLNHFVVLQRLKRDVAIVHDPAQGIRRLPLDEVSRHFTGIALELRPSADFSPARERQPVALQALTGRLRGLVPALFQIGLLAVALEVFTLATPFYMQWVIDQVLVSADRDLLTLLGLGFLAITAFSAIAGATRSWVVMWLGTNINVQWASNLFGHLMHLPLEWFEKRHMGDVVSRFGSIQSIQKTLTTQFIGSLLDGAMSLVTLVVMGFYNVWLALLVAGLFAVYGLVRWAFFKPLRRTSEEQIIYAARQQTELLESIRGAMSLKLANKESERQARYANATVATANRDIGIQRLSIAFTLANQLLFGFGRIALVWIGAALALDNKFSAGMLIAFIAYADQFTGRAIGLVDKWVDFRMLRLHAERIADIALTLPESFGEAQAFEPADASIELSNVSFRYAEDEPWILKDCNLRIEAGESVAIVGPSGCGKTTLAKLVLGLLKPTAGEVRFGDIDIQRLGLSHYRRLVSAVMQDDQLFAGTLAENISFFDTEARPERVVQAAHLAAIHADIAAMPMGYLSQVGDMGSALSGGQKQRVILARALYQQPRTLVLDEATSHLDLERERQINTAISHMSMTRIVIAHRPETVASAERVIAIGQTKTTETRESITDATP